LKEKRVEVRKEGGCKENQKEKLEKQDANFDKCGCSRERQDLF
jgi:hypothetical protein